MKGKRLPLAHAWRRAAQKHQTAMLKAFLIVAAIGAAFITYDYLEFQHGMTVLEDYRERMELDALPSPERHQ